MNTQANDNTVDNVNQPKHYTSHESGIECIQIAELLPFNLGSALKYLWRKGLKWDENEDVKKAIFYLRRQASLGKTPYYTSPEIDHLAQCLHQINGVDLRLHDICNIVVYGDFKQWLSLADRLQRESYNGNT